MNSVVSRLMSGVDFDLRLAAWPDTQIDWRLLNEAPPGARVVLKQAYQHYREGYNVPEAVWSDWAALLDNFGSEDAGVQLGLLGLIFLGHEFRHQIDVFATPTGWFNLSLVAGEYYLLFEFLDSTDSEEADALDRVRRHLARSKDLLGNWTYFNANEYDQAPLAERDLPDGILRVRVGRADPNSGILTLQHGTSERALSTSAVLECRALLETAGHTIGKLRAADVSGETTIDALELLLRLGVDPYRDDYWAFLASALPAQDFRTAAAMLSEGHPAKSRLMLSTWFGLHVQHPDVATPDIVWTPAFRTAFALNKLADVSDSQWANPKIDWESVMSQLAHLFDDEPLAESRERWKGSVASLHDMVASGAFGNGLAYEHINWLLECSKSGLDLRESAQPVWIDAAGWPPQEDAKLVALNGRVPNGARTSWSRLIRLHNLLRADAPPSSVRDLVASLR